MKINHFNKRKGWNLWHQILFLIMIMVHQGIRNAYTSVGDFKTTSDYE